MRRLLPLAGVAVASLLVITGCGSSGNENSASARQEWAGDVCSAFVTWESDLTSVGNQFKGGQNLSKSGLQSAVKQVETSTQNLVNSLKDVAKPPDPAADEVKQDVDELRNELSDGVDKIKSETSNISGAQGVLSAVSAASATVSSLAKDVSSTLTQLKSVDAKGAWKQAFSSAESCKTLKGS